MAKAAIWALVLVEMLCHIVCDDASVVSETLNTTSGLHVVTYGASPQFALFNGSDSSSYIRIRFGRLVELDAGGKPVKGRRLGPLASKQATFSKGNMTVDGATVKFISMQLNISALQFDDTASCSKQTPTGQRELTIKVFYGITTNVTFPYGADNNITVMPNSLKFNIEARDWPFCSDNNSLALDLVIKTGNNGTDQALVTDEAGSVEDITVSSSSTTTGTNATNGSATATSSTSPNPSRKLLTSGVVEAKQAAKQAGRNNADNTGAAPSNGGKGTAEDGNTAENRRQLVQELVRPKVGGKPNIFNRRPGGPEHRGKMAAFLLNTEQAAAFNLASYAYDAVDGTVKSNVTVLARQGDDDDHIAGNVTVSIVTLKFPAFTSLYYDPDVAITSAADAGYETVNVTTADAAAAGSTTNTTTKNAAGDLLGASLRAMLGLAFTAVALYMS